MLQPAPRLANASLVTPQLLVGGDLDPDDAVATSQLVELLALGVRHIVDARVEWTDESFVARHAPFVRYSHVGIDDAGQRIPAAGSTWRSRWCETTCTPTARP